MQMTSIDYFGGVLWSGGGVVEPEESGGVVDGGAD